MKIVYTNHAEQRLKERFIKRGWIRKTVNKPDKLLNMKNNRKKAVKKINGDKISVVYAEENNEAVVVTVYWGE